MSKADLGPVAPRRLNHGSIMSKCRLDNILDVYGDSMAERTRTCTNVLTRVLERVKQILLW